MSRRRQQADPSTATGSRRDGALELEERRFRALIENSLDAVVLLSPEGRVLYVSPSGERIDGVPTAERIGSSIFDAVHRDHRERLARDLARVARVADARASSEYRFRRRDGGWIWVEAVAHNLVDEPAVGAIVVNYRDVTDRVETEAALRRTERYHRGLIENGLDLISVIDAEGTIRYASPSHRRILGVTPGDLVGTNALDRVHPDDRSRTAQLFVDSMAKPGASPAIEFRYRCEDGSWRVLEAIGNRADPASGVEGFVVNARDVSERRLAEQRTAVLLEVAEDVSGASSASDLFARVQRRLAAKLPCDAVAVFRWDEERACFAFAAAHGLASPKDAEFARLTFAPFEPFGGRLAAGPVIVNGIAGAEGVVAQILERFRIGALLVAPLRATDRQLGALVAMRFREEDRFTSEDATLCLGVARHLVVAMERVELASIEQEAAQVSRGLARVGEELLASFHRPELPEQLCRLTNEVLGCRASVTLLWRAAENAFVPSAASGIDAGDWESIRLLRLSPDSLPEELTRLQGSPLVSGAGLAHPGAASLAALLQAPPSAAVVALKLWRGTALVGLQMAVFDQERELGPAQRRIAEGLSQLASMALEHARLLEQLDAANRLKSEFVAMMSHELRTPLNAIIGYGDLLSDGTFGPVTAEQADALRRIRRSSHELLALIREVLDLSRLESGRIPLDLREISITDLFFEVEAESTALRRGPGVDFEWRVDASLGRIVTDPAKLKTAVKNLVANAFKFTDAGRVVLAAEPLDGGVVISVADTGAGIPADSLEAIFEAFRQGDAALTRKHGGVGLGLYIVRRILDTLGGSASVESEVGRGSTFRLWIPAGPSSSISEDVAFSDLLQSTESEVAVVGPDGTILAVNERWRRFAIANGGGSHPPGVGWNYLDACIGHGGDGPIAERARAGLLSVIEGRERRFALEYRCDSPTEERWFVMTVTPVPDRPGHVLVVHTNVSKRRRMREVVGRQTTDPLTGLPGQALFCDRVADAVQSARSSGRVCAVVSVDLLRLGGRNAAPGSSGDDTLVRVAAERVRRGVREIDTLACRGGSELLVLMPNLVDADSVLAGAQSVLARIEQPLVRDGVTVVPRACVGAAAGGTEEIEPAALLRHAEIALAVARRSHRPLALYRGPEVRGAAAASSLSEDIDGALARGELEIRMQPILDADLIGTTSAEATVRWRHPRLGLLFPCEIAAAVAAAPPLALRLATWHVDAALAACASWQDADFGYGVSVVLSAAVTDVSALPSIVPDLLRRWRVSPRLLELAIDLEATAPGPLVEPLRALDRLGVQVAVVLSRADQADPAVLAAAGLRELRARPAVVQSLQRDEQADATARAIADAAHALGLGATAIGVETSGQIASVRRLGFDRLQGRGAIGPMSLGELGAWLRTRPRIDRQGEVRA